MQFADTATAEQRLDEVLTAMAILRKHCLLVIDNANEVQDLQQHYPHLRRCPNFHILLTTRITHFSQAAFYAIEGLPKDEALDLFRFYYKKHQPEEDALFLHLREAVGSNILVIELLAKSLSLLNRRKMHYTLADLLKDLQQKGVLALEHSKEVQPGGAGDLPEEKLHPVCRLPAADRSVD